MMNPSNPINLLFSLAEAENASHYLYPSPSHSRLILPKDTQYSKVALQFFSNKRQRLKMLLQRALTKESLYCVENDCMNSLKIAAGYPNAYPAVSLGTPGPYNKQTVLLLDNSYMPISITKVGANNQTSLLLKNEAYWLKTVNMNASLATFIPSVVQDSSVNSLFFLTQTVNTGTPSKWHLTEQHTKFLTLLQDTVDPTFHFGDSDMHSALSYRLQTLNGEMSKNWQQRADIALNHIIKTFENTEIPMVLAHRDFVPWNIKNDSNGIFVFDWEYTSQGYFPLYDIFHFIVMPLALKNKLSLNNIEDILRKAEIFGLSLNNGASKICHSKIQLLGYLLDVCLFYLESNNGNSVDDNIVNHYGLLIDKICK